MASSSTHVCVACNITLPMEDGHDKCIACLGSQHAEAARADPAACMDCFIMPLRTREARAHFFTGRQSHSHSGDDRAGKRQRLQSPDREDCRSFLRPEYSGGERDEDAISLFPSEEESVLTPGRESQGQRASTGTESSSVLQERPAVSQLQEVLNRAAVALDITLPEDPLLPVSRFEERDAPRPAWARVPLLPDFEAEVLAQFHTPARACRWSSVSRRLANVSEAGRIGCDRPPPLDQSLAALVSPAGSALGPTSCPTAKEQAVAAGKAIASLWVARRHLWLAQSRFQPADRTSLIGLPVEPTAMFGSGALTMLQQAQEARRYATVALGPPHVKLCRHNPVGAQGTLGSSWFIAVNNHSINTAGHILQFLQEQLAQGKSAATLRGMVAAIKASRVGNWSLSERCCTLISQFLKGAQRQTVRPKTPMVPPWDLDRVLGALQHAPFEPIETVELKWLSLKTALLLAVCSARRIGELHALSVHRECCRLLPGNAGVVLRPNPAFLPKVLSDANLNQTIELSPLPPTLEEDGTGYRASALCPVRALLCYMERTSSVRKTDQLFVCFKTERVGEPLSKSRLSRWVVEAIRQAYTDTEGPTLPGLRAHSTRGMATSWALWRGASLQEICKAATWSTASTFAKYYSLNIAASPSFGERVLAATRP
ncbi:hypothetical protein N1851_013231 [Merluccius polli]|uniref:Tyr recombinase domain-containing protein n=1 Tax=Merluccius polli TaxID=89951 RepID=A0AA47P4I6_MERPO|nr:hypothetical protein N1851_013231 [Merluccius polli]